MTGSETVTPSIRRVYLLRELGLGRDQVSISGYWRRGRAEEGFREWKSQLAKAEAAT